MKEDTPLLKPSPAQENPAKPHSTVLADIKHIIAQGQNTAYNAVNTAQIMTFWTIGRRIVEEEQQGNNRAGYGKRLISILADELTKEYGSGYTDRNLRNFRQFYLYFPDPEIWHACVPNLKWTHIRSILRVEDETARLWYLNEAAKANWSARTLDRNIATQYYCRLLSHPTKTL